MAPSLQIPSTSQGTSLKPTILRCRKSELLSEVIERSPKHVSGRVSGGAVTERLLGAVDRLLYRGPILGQTNEFLVEHGVGDEPASEAFQEDFFCPDQLLLPCLKARELLRVRPSF
jgi:hypothetical protein